MSIFTTLLKERDQIIRHLKDDVQDVELYLREAELDPRESLRKALETLTYLKIQVVNIEILVKGVLDSGTFPEKGGEA